MQANVKVSVYYECRCPDSKDFIMDQLLPVYAVHKRSIDVDFVPYGKATVSNAAGLGMFG